MRGGSNDGEPAHARGELGCRRDGVLPGEGRCRLPAQARPATARLELIGECGHVWAQDQPGSQMWSLQNS